MYKAVISDLDGTLLKSHEYVTDFSKDVIKKIIDKGIKFYIATGRAYPDAKEIMESIGLKAPIITSNGSRINGINGELIYENDIDEEYKQAIMDIDYKKYGKEIHFNAYSDNEWYIVEDIITKITDFKVQDHFPYNKISMDDLRKKDIMKFFYVGHHVDLLRLEKEILDVTNGSVNLAFTLPECLEVFDKEVSKGNAIKILEELGEFNKEEVVAFGDGFNDYEMLSTVGKGFIMGNAHYKLKEALSDKEVIGSNDEDSVAKKLIELFL